MCIVTRHTLSGSLWPQLWCRYMQNTLTHNICVAVFFTFFSFVVVVVGLVCTYSELADSNGMHANCSTITYTPQLACSEHRTHNTLCVCVCTTINRARAMAITVASRKPVSYMCFHHLTDYYWSVCVCVWCAKIVFFSALWSSNRTLYDRASDHLARGNVACGAACRIYSRMNELEFIVLVVTKSFSVLLLCVCFDRNSCAWTNERHRNASNRAWTTIFFRALHWC